MNKIFNILLIMLFCGTGSLIAEGTPIQIEAVESFGMGGVGTAIKGRYDVLYNPALLGLRSGFHLRLFDMPVSISNDILKFYQFFSDNQEELEQFDTQTAAKQADLLKEITDTVTKYKIRFKIGVLNPSISAGSFPLTGPDSKFWFGVGLYNQLDAGVKMNAGLLVPTIDFWAVADAQLVFPVAYRIPRLPLKLPGDAIAGVNVKILNRYKFEENRMSILAFEDFDIQNDLKKGSGYGWDWGLLYNYSEKFKFSFVLKDFLSSRISYDDDSSEVIKCQVSLGTSYQLNKMILLAADVRDIKLDDIGKATMFTKLYMGGELNLLKILMLRGGFYQGYPSFGFGLLGFINYAFYGRELSSYPGSIPEWNHVISLSVGF